MYKHPLRRPCECTGTPHSEDTGMYRKTKIITAKNCKFISTILYISAIIYYYFSISYPEWVLSNIISLDTTKVFSKKLQPSNWAFYFYIWRYRVKFDFEVLISHSVCWNAANQATALAMMQKSHLESTVAMWGLLSHLRFRCSTPDEEGKML